MRDDFVEDSTKLFQVSGMVDSLRDSAQEMMAAPAAVQDAALATQLLHQYNLLRDQLRMSLTGNGRKVFDSQVPVLDVSNVHLVAFCAGQMSRFAQLAHDLPKFALAQKANGLAMAKMDEKIADSDFDAFVSSVLPPSAQADADSDRRENSGMYL